MAFTSLTKLRKEAIVVVALLLLLLSSLHLMSSSIQHADNLSRMYVPLLIFNVIGLMVLLGFIGINLFKIFKNTRQKRAGSRLTLRMVIMFSVLSVMPIAVIYYYSLQFLLFGIDSWFDVELDTSMENAMSLSRASLDLHKRERMRQLSAMTDLIDISSSPATSLSLADLRTSSEAVELAVYSLSGQVMASSNVDPTDLVPVRPDEIIMDQVRSGEAYAGLLPYGENSKLHVRIAMRDPNKRNFILTGLFPISANITDLGEKVETAYNRYKELNYIRQSLKFSFSLTLLLVLIFGLFAAVWAAIYMARRIVSPITNIAEGTRAVALGEYDTQLPTPQSKDELSFLVSSFNSMTRRIAQSRDEVNKSRQKMETQHTYLQTIMTHLNSGVMSFDDEYRLKTANAAASELLQCDLERFIGARFNDLGAAGVGLEQLLDRIREPLITNHEDWATQLSIYYPDQRQVLNCAVTALQHPSGQIEGHIIVFEDITDLVKAQRDAAWGEVARRLAHEIKNPLTPIQLSAERIRRKCLDGVGEKEIELLDKTTTTIIHQVDAMKEMVNAFSEYARPPRLSKEPLAIDNLLAQIADLYSEQKAHKILKTDLQAPDALIKADSVRIRQVIHNLLKNALEASEKQTPPEVILSSRIIATGKRQFVQIAIDDNGEGIPESLKTELFRPYVTTKTKGTGLGLAIVLKHVEEHRGTVNASDRPTGGTRFVVKLPLYDNNKMAEDGEQ